MSIIAKSNPWELYDRLIEGIPSGIGVKNWSLGRRWSFVESEAGCGIAMTVSGGSSLGKGGGSLSKHAASSHMPELKALATHARSWCFEEASVGIAALNAFYNTPANNPELKACLEDGRDALESSASVSEASALEAQASEMSAPLRQGDIVSAEIRAAAGKKVAVIGHFPHLDELVDICELAILERNPSGIDLPDSACEYILPTRDLVIMTGTTLTNKTMKRLLELCENARTVLAGPSCVCSATLFDYGVDIIGGALVTNSDEARLRVSHGIHLPFGHGVEMIRFAPTQSSPHF
jgi:uncharacterized protein (DUF4213/DUF364 family)